MAVPARDLRNAVRPLRHRRHGRDLPQRRGHRPRRDGQRVHRGLARARAVPGHADPELEGLRVPRRGPFAVNVLAADQVDTALHFAGRPAGPGPEWAEGPTAPVLVGAAAVYSCQPWRTYDGGDHLIVVGEVDARRGHRRRTAAVLRRRLPRARRRPRPARTGPARSTAPRPAGSTRRTTFTPLRPHAA